MRVLLHVTAGTALAFALSATAAGAQISRVGSTEQLNVPRSLPTNAAEVRGIHTAYDPVNRVFLVVTSFGGTYGVFVNAETGLRVAPPFLIESSGSTFGEYPRAEYSPHLANGAGGYGAFLVTWANFPVGVSARVVSYSAGTIGDVVSVGTTPARGTTAPAIAYSPTSRKFLIAWQTTTANIYSRIIAVTSSGLPEARGSERALTGGFGAQRPDLAWNPTSDQFGLSYTAYDNDWNAWVAFVGISAGTEVAQAPATMGNVAGPLAGTFMSEIEYNVATGRYVLAWTYAAGSLSAEVTPSGQVQGARLVTSDTGGNDNLGLAFNPISGTFLLVGQYQYTYEIAALELQSDGTAIGDAREVTNGAGQAGSYYPKVSSSATTRRFDIAYSQGYFSMASQLIATASTGSGGGDPPPPPPPPPCSYVATSSNTALPPAAGNGSVTITTTGTNCAWTATSNASWLAMGTASGTNTQTVTFSYQSNPLQQARSATITIGGRTISVSQGGRGRQVLDFNLDNRFDFLIRHDTEGWIGTWKMNGTTLLDGALLSPERVGDVKWQIVGTADLNGDNWSDIVWQHADGWLAVWEMSGVFRPGDAKYLNPQQPLRLPSGWVARGLHDMNTDGDPDVIIQNRNTGEVGAWLLNGINYVDGALFSTARVPDTKWQIAASEDFNGDGEADLVWQHSDNVPGASLAIWFMKGLTVSSVEWLNPGSMPSDAWKIRGAGDVDGDGRADLLVQNERSGDVGAWLMNGKNRIDARSFVDNSGRPVALPRGWSIVGPR